MLINKDTSIYCSFSQTPGNNGCKFFNSKFKENNINAIYKSFYSGNIENSINAVKTLGIKGFAVSMPFKTTILKYVDEKTPEVKAIGAANTIVNQDSYLKAYNTDWIGVYHYLLKNLPNGLGKATLYILGNGGFSKSTQYACDKLNFKYKIITRENWDLVPHLKGITINCTPVKVTIDRGMLIDGRPTSDTGKIIAQLQALEQYKIYTNET